jgi:hypothetical protein
VHSLELDLKHKDAEIAYLKTELEAQTANLAQAKRDKEELIAEEMGLKHSDTMLRVIK